MPLITRRTQIAIETATAYASSPTFSAADVVSTEIYDPVFTIQSEQFERNTARSKQTANAFTIETDEAPK